MSEEVVGGPEWLAELPRLIAECVEQWSVELEEPIDTGFSFVARRRGVPEAQPAG